jgi:hypothetical protein
MGASVGGTGRVGSVKEMAMEGFTKPRFWISMAAVFGLDAVAFAVLGAALPALSAAVTASLALVTAAALGRKPHHPAPEDGAAGPLQGA